ncbi:hypothetical protein SESBI_49379 [Sesbania bispinosa]|nr:hypothetical protein SESBI_49379 [Sesbania bispinosa]
MRSMSEESKPAPKKDKEVGKKSKKGASGVLNATNEYSDFGSSQTNMGTTLSPNPWDEPSYLMARLLWLFIIVAANPSETVTTRKSRRKKTLAELKEEESLLLKERRSLKNELASLRLIVEKRRATNESLKRMKLDLESQQNSNATTASELSGKITCGASQFVEA